MHIHKSAADSGFRAQMQRVKSRRSSSLFSVWLLSALNQPHLMLRCLFEPYGKWEIFTYIIAGKKAMKVIDVPILLQTCFYPANNISALTASTLFHFSLQPTTNSKFPLFSHSKIWPSSQLVAQLMCSARLCRNKMPFRGPVDMSAEKGSCECILAPHLQFPKDEPPLKSLILDTFILFRDG